MKVFLLWSAFVKYLKLAQINYYAKAWYYIWFSTLCFVLVLFCFFDPTASNNLQSTQKLNEIQLSEIYYLVTKC